VPTVESPPTTPPALQVTADVAAPFRNAENCCVDPARTVAVPGDIVKFGGGGGVEEALSPIPEQPIANHEKTRARANQQGRFDIADPPSNSTNPSLLEKLFESRAPTLRPRTDDQVARC
jgi:hypothetical protein